MWISGNRYLSLTEMEENAKMIWAYFKPKGWSLNAVCGMLGNMQSESTINPAIWESLDEGNLDNGLGLVQWTPATKLIEWVGLSYLDGDKQCERIQYELENNLQWIATSEYPMSFQEFHTSNDTPYNLAMAFISNYERPFDSNQPIRGEQANYWYKILEGTTPQPQPQTKKKMPLYMYMKRR